jgi:hypothetical protein
MVTKFLSGIMRPDKEDPFGCTVEEAIRNMDQRLMS